MIAWLAPVGGLALLAGLPLAIHLLSRRTRRERPYPGLALLARAHGGRARIGALRERLALLVRILALAALLTAASAPLWRSTAGASGSPVVIIVDASASMQQRSGATTAWTQAVGAAGRLADGLGQRPIQLLIAGNPVRRSAALPETDRGALRALLSTANPGWGAGSLDAAVGTAVAALAGGGDLYVVSDGSRTALAGVDPSALPTGIAWHLVTVGGEAPNVALRALAVEPGRGRVGQPLTVQAEVANFTKAEVALTVRLEIGGTASEHSVRIPAGSSASVVRTFTPTTAGRLELSAAITARTGEDALADDDHRSGTVEIVTRDPVDLFTDADPRDPAGAVRPLLAALTAAGLAPTVHPGATLAPTLRARPGGALVLTAGLAALREESGAALAEHLRHGGIWLQVAASDADARLSAGGIDPPARPGAVVDLSARPRGLGLGTRKLDHPLTTALLGREPLLARLEAWRYRPAPPLAGSTVLLAWADGSAALALRPVGPGWWLQLGISPADGDTSLAALELLPLIMAHLGEVGGPRRLTDAALPCDRAVRGTTAKDPDGATIPATSDGSIRLARPGRWEIDGGPLAAAIPAGESDLRPAPAGPEHQTATTAGVAVAALGDHPLWPWCLLVAALLLAGELLLVGGLPRPAGGRA